MEWTSLSPRIARFVAEYLVDGNGAQAAVRAGYARSGAKVQAARLLKNEQVLAAVRSGQREISHRLALSRERALQGLLEAIDMARAAGDVGAMIAGWREIGRLMGYYQPDKTKQVHVNIMAKRVIEQMEMMSDADLVKLVEVSGAGA